MAMFGTRETLPRRLRGTIGLLMVLMMLAAACTSGVNTAEPSGDSGGDESAPASDDPGGGSDTITVWYLQDTDELVEEAIPRFNEEFPDVTVEARAIENDPYKTQLQTAMGTEAAPDVFHSWGGGYLEQFVDAGQVAPLDDYLAEQTEWSDMLPEATLEPASFDGSVYAVPAILGQVQMWYRTDIFEEHGLEPPETYDDLLDIVETLKENDVTPFTLANSTRWPGAFWLIYLAARSGEPETFMNAYNREGGASFEDEAFVNAGERIQELVEMDAFVQGFNGLNYDTGESRAPLWSGDAAMELMGDWTYNAAVDEAPDIAESSLSFFEFPAIEPPDGTGDTGTIVGGLNGAFSVAESSGNKDAAMAFVRYLTDAESAQVVVDAQLGTPNLTEGVEITDEIQQRFVDAMAEADHLQLYYDQFLPPELAEVHLDTTQGLFGQSMTPEEAASAMETAAQEELTE